MLLGALTKDDKRAVELSPKDIIMHEEYSRVTGVNDIALVRLGEEISYSGRCEVIYKLKYNKYCNAIPISFL